MTPSPTLQAGDEILRLKEEKAALEEILSRLLPLYKIKQLYAGMLSNETIFKVEISKLDGTINEEELSVLISRMSYELSLMQKFNKPPNTTGDRDE